MTERVKQQICINFYIKLEHSSEETIQVIQKAFRDNAMIVAQIEVWHKCFKDGQQCVESDSCSRRPATSRTPENVEGVRAAINKDRRLTVWELEADLGIPKTTVSKMLMQDLGMKHVVARSILWLLLTEQKEHRAAVGRAVWGPKVPTLKGTEASLSYVQCFLYLVSSSINVSLS